MKYFCISDVHGFYNEMLRALTKAGFDVNNPNHVLVHCGDALDRGSQPEEVLDFFMNKVPSDRRILVRGNHEDLMENAIARGVFGMHDFHNGTAQTAFKLTGTLNETEALFEMSRHELYNRYIRECLPYYETKNAVFVHGWVPCEVVYPYKLDENWREGDWKGARWINGMEAWSKGIRVPDKTVLCGHWHASWGHSHLHGDGAEFPNNYMGLKAHFSPFIDDNIVALDACTALSHKVNCYVFEDKPLED